MEEALDALSLLDEGLEHEGYQYEDKFDEFKAINFVKRFPMYYSALQIITRDLRTSVKEMKAEIDRLYAIDAKLRKEVS